MFRAILNDDLCVAVLTGYNPDYPGEGTIFAKYILSKTPQAKVGVLVQNDPFGGQLLAGLRRGFAPNSKSRIVDVEPADVTAPGLPI